MFKLPFQSAPYSGKDEDEFAVPVTAPPIARVDIILGPNWDRTVGGDPSKVAQDIVNQNIGRLQQYFLGQQQNHPAGVGDFWAGEIQLPNLKARYSASHGTEMLFVEVYPSNTGGKKTTLPMGSVFDIGVPFTGWPLALYVWSESNPGYIINGNNYLPDPLFVPGLPTAANPKLADMYPNSSLFNQQFGLYASISWDQDPNSPNYLFIDPLDYNGFPYEWWTHGVGGSGICPTAVSGMQYIEVEILELPTATPPSLTRLTGNYFRNEYTSNPCYYFGVEKHEWSWPSELNTFWSPTIGLVPKPYLDPSWTKNTVAYGGVIHLDPDPFPKARSIGVTRMSSKTYTKKSSRWTNGYFYITGGTDPNGKSWPGNWKLNYEVGQQPFDQNPYIQWSGNINYSSGFYFGGEGQWLTLSGSGNGSVYGATALACATAGKLGIVTVGTAGFYVLGEVGQVMDTSINFSNDGVSGPVALINGILGYQPGEFITTSGSVILGDFIEAQDAFTNRGANKYSGLNAVGRKAPVIKGRLDSIHLTVTPEQDTPISNNDYSWQDNAVWTGVDITDIVVHDTVMVAWNTKTREVWFGKNGTWYDMHGPSKYQPGDARLLAATYMDGDQTVDYYPACSFRLGPLKMRMKFGSLQKYPPPSGFQSYSAAPSVTI